jgi:hypothetical protein
VTERCWHGKFTATQCCEPGRYGNPGYRFPSGRPKLNTTVKFMRAARWCVVHRHPEDVLLEADVPDLAAPNTLARGEEDRTA